ncbi:MAG TPA: GH116 family glycosyl hydrolase [Sedimentisphaerales bacterium]|nr:GH116 family glycosyl hydrolase [Sedimentisphaerales bacterium]
MRRCRTMQIAAIVGMMALAGGLAAQETAKISHFVPADKSLPQGFETKLFQRGEPAVWSGEELETIGMPIGGIATGQLYLRGDGTLGLWQIFNKHVFSGYGRDNYRTYRPDSPVDSGFAVGIVSEGKVTLRPLNKDFGRVEFIGEYPIAVVRYQADDLPLQVQMEAFSPFIPLNAKDSALPATVFHITLKNTGDRICEAGVLSWLQNAVLFDSAKAVCATRESRLVQDRGRGLIVHTAKETPQEQGQAPRPKIVLNDFEALDYGHWKVTGEAFGTGPARGTLANQQRVSGFLGEGLVNTFLGGDRPHGTLTSPAFEISRRYINFLIGGGSHADQTCINLLVDDKVVQTATGKDNEKLQWRSWNVENLQGQAATIQIVDRNSGAWGHINIDQIELADESYEADLGPFDKLPDFGSLVLALADPLSGNPNNPPSIHFDFQWARGLYAAQEATYPATEKRSMTAMTRPANLAPGQEHTFTFVLAWHFPNHPQGHEYTNRFKDAVEVAHYVLDNHDRLTNDTKSWCKTFYEDSTLPRWLLFRLHSTVCNLATGTCQWWQSGRFWAWEGVGCCEGTCTHVWNYAHAPARLFPELERSAREMQDFGEGFDTERGLVGFRSNRAYAADGQCGTILKAYREHQCSADDSFLRRNWPRIKKALEFSISQDGNDDGLIENSQHNTYDINFEGPNTFVGSLYLAALRAGEEMAKEIGDTPFAQRCRRIFESGSKLSVERLWDGDYFIQIVDLQKHPKDQYARGCLSDQLFGQGWAHQLGLGYIYPEVNVHKALASVWIYNWASDVGPQNEAHPPERWFALPGEPGLFTCTWPKSPYLQDGVRYREEIWTGIEYQVAGHMVWENMLTEALAICRGVEDRYHPAKHNPYNEVECGDHYARAMASWGVYTALAGFEYHGPKGHIGFAPRITPENYRAAFTAAEGWGSFSQTRKDTTQQETIELRWGRLALKTLAFAIPQTWKAARVEIQINDKTLSDKTLVSDGRVTIELDKRMTLAQGDRMTVRIHQQP